MRKGEMMERNGYILNDNRYVIQMLAREIGRSNKGRNRILTGAVCVCIITLTVVFGVSLGKVRAEYMQAVRTAGTAASACIEGANHKQYEKISALGYVKWAGRSVLVGEGLAIDGTVKKEREDSTNGEDSERRICQIRGVDDQAWEELIKPAYTDISGNYPEKEQELMLPVKALEALGVSEPEIGMKIALKVNVGLFRTVREEFLLCGWYTDYMENGHGLAFGYVSEEKLRSWGYDMDRESDVLIYQANSMDWRETEERLYKDIPGEIRLSVHNTAAYDAVRLTAGGYKTAALGVVVVLGGMFFLVYNVMGISMAGDIRQMGLFNTIGATGRQLRKVYIRQILSVAGLGAAVGTVVSSGVLGFVIPKILGSRYMDGFGGTEEVRFFHIEILATASISAVLLTVMVSARVIFRAVNMSCVESVNYTGIKPRKRRTEEDGLGRRHKEKHQVRYRKRSTKGALLYMAWQNVMRYKGRFVYTVCSLFLGIGAFFWLLSLQRKATIPM